VAAFFRECGGRVELSVRLTPKSATDQVSRVVVTDDGRAWLSVKVRAAPEKGSANAALLRVLAEALAIPKSALKIEAGQTSRLKTVRLESDAPSLVEKLRRLAEG
jgi:uncharacterized protein YggU (UPF0235/DUF167 family)